MNQDQLRRAESGLTNIARKVLSAIPLDEPWRAQDIAQELFRVTRSRVDINVLMGCINNLMSHGLVREKPSGMYRRCYVYENESVAEPPTEPKAKAVESKPATPLRAPKVDEHFLDTLARAAGELRNLSSALVRVAALIEDAALNAQKAVEDEKQKSVRFDHLRALINGE